MTPPEDTHRLALTVHYDGTAHHGWQVQGEHRTVQGELDAAVQRLTGDRRPSLGSGRTDTGVHATGQVVSLDVPVKWSPKELRRALNAVLPDDVWIREARRVSPRFHPRFDAVARTYEYRIGLDSMAWSPFHRRWCWPLAAELDIGLLDKCASLLHGEHSFAAFAKSGQPQRGDRCTVLDARWRPWEAMGMSFTITANRYLHRMVRYLVGTMVDVGRGRRPTSDLRALLSGATGVRETSPPAPPRGLFLTHVEYSAESFEPTDASAAPPFLRSVPDS